MSDEEVYARAIKEFHALNETGKPFLGTIMSVSNHKPYTYPDGRIPEPALPKATRREKAVKYADWCLEPILCRREKRTVLDQHRVCRRRRPRCPRLRQPEHPNFSPYEIPLVILGPAVVKSPSRIGQLGCSLDVSPTVLGLLGRPYDTLFFGRDLLREEQPNDGRVFINHNRDIGIMEKSSAWLCSACKTPRNFIPATPKLRR